MNWITKFIKPKVQGLFKKKSSQDKDTLWTNCSCNNLILKDNGSIGFEFPPRKKKSA